MCSNEALTANFEATCRIIPNLNAKKENKNNFLIAKAYQVGNLPTTAVASHRSESVAASDRPSDLAASGRPEIRRRTSGAWFKPHTVGPFQHH